MTYDPETYWPARYERQGPTYVAKGGRRDSYREQVEAITPYLDHLPTTGRVLDFGCGPQRFRPALEARGLEYEGVDLIPGLGTMDAADIETGSFDAAIAFYVLQHIVDDEEYEWAVRTIFDALQPGGVLLVVDSEPLTDPDPHMFPRGCGGLMRAPWWSLDIVGGYDGHWIGLLERGR